MSPPCRSLILWKSVLSFFCFCWSVDQLVIFKAILLTVQNFLRRPEISHWDFSLKSVKAEISYWILHYNQAAVLEETWFLSIAFLLWMLFLNDFRFLFYKQYLNIWQNIELMISPRFVFDFWPRGLADAVLGTAYLLLLLFFENFFEFHEKSGYFFRC